MNVIIIIWATLMLVQITALVNGSNQMVELKKQTVCEQEVDRFNKCMINGGDSKMNICLDDLSEDCEVTIDMF